jgi:hypothetical protein
MKSRIALSRKQLSTEALKQVRGGDGSVVFTPPQENGIGTSPSDPYAEYLLVAGIGTSPSVPK